MSGYTPTLQDVFNGPLCGRWPAVPVWLSLVALADNDGRVERIHRAICSVTGWPEELLRAGLKELEGFGYITRLYDHLDWGWQIAGFDKVFPAPVRRLAWPEWAEIREAIFIRDNFTCQYCGGRGGNLECDHIQPLSRGGSNNPSNLATSCRTCNRSKRAKTVTEWQG